MVVTPLACEEMGGYLWHFKPDGDLSHRQAWEDRHRTAWKETHRHPRGKDGDHDMLHCKKENEFDAPGRCINLRFIQRWFDSIS